MMCDPDYEEPGYPWDHQEIRYEKVDFHHDWGEIKPRHECKETQTCDEVIERNETKEESGPAFETTSEETKRYFQSLITNHHKKK